MNDTTAARSRLNRQSNVAFVVVVLAAYASLLGSVGQYSAWQLTTLVVLGVAFTALGLWGFPLCERKPIGWRTAAYFAAELAVGGAIVAIGNSGLVGLLLFPVASQAATCLPSRWVVLVCAFILVLSVAPIALAIGVSVAIQAALGYLAGIIFVIVFTQIAASEERARAEVERLAQELSEANQRLRSYAVQAEELATVRERNRLAREIHDSLGHYLTTVNMQLEAARAVMESEPAKALDALQKAQALTREGLADVRRSVASLRAAPAAEYPLPEALAELAADSGSSGLPTELTLTGTPRELTPAAHLTLFRAAQEGLTNVRKHAQAGRAELGLDYGTPGLVRLSLEDNGKGALSAEGGFGLLGIRERVHLLGGDVVITTSPGSGFKLEITLPAGEAAAGNQSG
jgi:signal transduction histidine kinase